MAPSDADDLETCPFQSRDQLATARPRRAWHLDGNPLKADELGVGRFPLLNLQAKADRLPYPRL